MVFFFKNTIKAIILTEEDEQHYRKTNFCRLCEKEINVNKVRDHCHLTDNQKSPAQNKCNINVTQQQSIFIPFLLPNFSNYDCHLISKRWQTKRLIK